MGETEETDPVKSQPHPDAQGRNGEKRKTQG